MAFDGIVTRAIISELNSSLIGAKVNKVLQPTKSEVVLELYGSGKNYSLVLSCDAEFCRICLSTHLKPNPQNAFNFCMLLRKYLVGGKILEISNYDLERTVQIKFSCYNELNDLVTRKLYIEIMSRQSNLVLTNENNIIIANQNARNDEFNRFFQGNILYGTFIVVSLKKNRRTSMKKKDIRKFSNMFKLSKHEKKIERFKEEFLEEYYYQQRKIKQKNRKHNKEVIFKNAA